MTSSFIVVIGLAGLVLGAVVGAIAQLTTFCSVGAVADIVLARDWRRMRSWLMAVAVAVLGTQALAALGLLDLSVTLYSLPPDAWAGVAVGSIAFGYGMAQAGGCVQRALVRLGGGSIRSLVTLAIVAVTAAATILLLPPVEFVAPVVQGPSAFIAASVIALALTAFCLKDSWFRASPGHLWGGTIVGAIAAIAWIFADSGRGLNPLLDLGFAAAHVANESAALPIFGLGGLIGMILGATLVAAARRDLCLDRFVDAADVKRHVLGGVLMGVGGALAAGCTFGQGLAGFSTLSIGSVIAIAGMVAGCLWGIRALEAGSAWGGLKLVFRAR